MLSEIKFCILDTILHAQTVIEPWRRGSVNHIFIGVIGVLGLLCTPSAKYLGSWYKCTYCHHHHQHYPFVLDWRLWTPGLGMTNGRRDVTRSKAQRARLVYSHLPDRITYLLMYHIMTLVGLEEYNWRQWR